MLFYIPCRIVEYHYGWRGSLVSPIDLGKVDIRRYSIEFDCFRWFVRGAGLQQCECRLRFAHSWTC
eukprot:1763422-Pyramimonas_sp.AAC.1